VTGTRRRRALLAAALVLAVFAAYAPALRAGFVWDDDDYVTNNPLLREPDGLRRIWLSFDQPSQYFPLTYTSFRLEYALFGLDPRGYHAVNVALHAANALGVGALLARLGVPGAAFAAALFALHPVHVESVAWVTERKNTLSLFFSLLSLLAWTRFAAPGARPSRGAYAASLGAFALALCAKTTACTLPAAQLAILWLRGTLARRRVAAILPFLALGLVMGLVTVFWERAHQGTRGERFELSLAESALVAGRALWFYLGKLAWPADLAFSYPKFAVDPADPLQWAAPLSFAALLAALWLARGHVGRGPFAALAFFAATLAPLLGFVPLFTFLYTYVADHYQYVASIGPLALAAGAAARALARASSAARRAGLATGLALLAGLGALTHRQARAYHDAETLWRDVLAKNPGSWMAHANLGRELLRQDRPAEAAAAYQAALAVRGDMARAHQGLAVALLALGRRGEAVAHFEEALAVDPRFVAAHERLGSLRLEEGDAEAALRHFEAIVQAVPDAARSHVLLARALVRAGRADEARARFREALVRDPRDAPALRGLACAGAPAEAVRLAARAAAGARPDPALVGALAFARAAAGDGAGAARLAEQAAARAAGARREALARRLRREAGLWARGAQPCAEPAGDADRQATRSAPATPPALAPVRPTQ
jgi:tetratricopeptide (TPR) repeat protein